MRWTFTQLGGDLKALSLDAYAAPFGRPRQKALFEETVKIRQSVTRYPGNSGPPTRHIYGHQWDDQPLTLSGRWMTRHLDGTTTAADMVDDWQKFVTDEQPIRLKWGSLLSFVGVVESIHVAWESQNEVAWSISVLIDNKDSSAAAVFNLPSFQNTNFAAFNLALLEGMGRIKGVQIPSGFQPDFFDQIDFLTGSLNSAINNLVNLANFVSVIEQRTFSALQRVRLAIGEIRTASLIFGAAVDSAIIDSQMFTRQSISDLQWFRFRSETAYELSVMADILAELARSVEIMQRGDSGRSYQASANDTWETISTNMYGGISRANDIRQANGITGATQPTPGAVYRIPV